MTQHKDFSVERVFECVNVVKYLPVYYICYWRIPAEGTQAFMLLSLVSKGTLVVWFIRD